MQGIIQQRDLQSINQSESVIVRYCTGIPGDYTGTYTRICNSIHGTCTRTVRTYVLILHVLCTVYCNSRLSIRHRLYLLGLFSCTCFT